jgi:drug/metabolite transporter (DMT)-like permease
MSSAPAITALLAFFILSEILTLQTLIGMLITIVGITVVILERNSASTARLGISKTGLLYGFLGALGQGAGLIFARMAFNLGEVNGFVATFIRISTASIMLLPLLIITKRYKDPVGVFSRDTKALRFTILGSILGPFLGITFSLIAIAHTQVGIAATIMATVPILMLPFVRIIYKEKLTFRAIIGACVAVTGVALLFLN